MSNVKADVGFKLFFFTLLFTLPLLAGCGGGNASNESPSSTIPSVRTYPSAIYDGNGNMVIFGGGNTQAGFNDVWAYNISMHAWSELRSSNPAPSVRRANCAFYDGKGGLIIFGGYAGTDYPDYRGTHFNDVWRYDISNQTWTKLDSSSGPSPRAYFGAVYDGNDNIIIFGGWGPLGLLNDVWKYNISSQTWTMLASAPGPPKQDGTSAFYDGNGNIIIFGGYDGELMIKDMWKYSISNQTWTKLSSSLPFGRECHISIYDGNGGIIIFGGADDNGLLNDMWRYDITLQTWTRIVNTDPIPSARWGHCGVYDMSGKIIMFGGQTSTDYRYMEFFQNDLWEYNISSQKWTKIVPSHQ